MDYEKKYNEALETARNLYPVAHSHNKAMLEQIFHELRESDEETTREELLDFVRSFWADHKEKIPQASRWLAYLEKQKEQKSTLTPERIRPKFAVGDTVCRPMWSEHTIREIYVRCDDPVYICVNEEGTESHILMSEQDEWERKEQKPVEWSEEDERMRNQLIYDVEYHKKEGLISAKQNKAAKELYDGIEKCYDEKIAWLKSLSPQPKQEWSEEEKGILLECVSALQNSSHWVLADKLLSLHPKSRWKPSEEQMDALAYAIQLLDDGLSPKAAKAGEELEHLRELLKKL